MLLHVHRDHTDFSQKKLHYGVPQSSVLGPVLFTLYIEPLSKVISRSRCDHHRFADDTQLHQSSTPSDFHSLIVDVELCVDSAGRWMAGNRLKLNSDKTDTLLVGSRERVSVSQENHLRVGNNDTSFKGRVKNLGVYTDATLSMMKHTDHIRRSAFLEIRRISSVRHLLTTKAAAQPMCSFVLNRLDYCNSLFIDIKWDQITGCKTFSTMQRRLFFARADICLLGHCSRHFTGCQSKRGLFFKIATFVFRFCFILFFIVSCHHTFRCFSLYTLLLALSVPVQMEKNKQTKKQNSFMCKMET